MNVSSSSWRAVGWGLVALLAAAGAYAFLATPADRAPAVDVRTAAVSTGPIVRRVVAAGTIEAASTVDVGAQVSGTIQHLDADFNSTVRRGQVLARLDPSVYEAQVARARAGLAQARAELARTEAIVADTSTKLARARELAAAGLATGADLETARTRAAQAAADRRSAQASITVAQAAFRQAQVNLDHTVVRSPIDGVVVSRVVEVGQTVAARQTVPVFFTIARDFRQVTLEQSIDEADVAHVRPGQTVTFEVSAFPGERFDGIVEHVRLEPDQSATITELPNGLLRAREPRVTTYTVVVGVDNLGERLRPGMTAIATTAIPECDNCLRVPNDALAFRLSPDVLAALDSEGAEPPDLDAAAGEFEGAPAAVWHFDGERLQPSVVYVGAQGDQYTAIVGGALDPSRRLVTSARLPPAARSQMPTTPSPFTPQRPRRRFRFP